METYNKLEIAKMAVRWTSQFGTTAIIRGLVTQVTEPETLVEKTEILVGSFMLGGLVAKHVGDYSDEQFDEAVSIATKVRDSFRKGKSEAQAS